MTPGEIALIAQLLALTTQAITAAINIRKQAGDAANATEQANLATAHTNFQSVIDSATKALAA